MTTAGTWYPPSAGTGGFLSDALLLSNPPFATMANITALLDWVLDHRHEHQNCLLMDMLDLARMWDRCEIGPDKRVRVEALEARWGVTGNAVSTRLSNLKCAGLVVYERGSWVESGYRFHRVGPPELALQQDSRRAAA